MSEDMHMVKLDQNTRTIVDHDHPSGLIIIKQKRVESIMTEDGVEDIEVKNFVVFSAKYALEVCQELMGIAGHMMGPDFDFEEAAMEARMKAEEQAYRDENSN